MKFIEAAGSVLRRPLDWFLPQGPTLVEKQYKIAEVLRKYPVTNEAIWWHIIVQRGFLTEEERDGIVRTYRTYREITPDTNTPVADILEAARLGRIRDKRLFAKVCFNYDLAWGAEDRVMRTIDEVAAGKWESVNLNSPDFWTIEQWVDLEFSRMQGHPMRVLHNERRFNKAANGEEVVYYSNAFGISDFDSLRTQLPQEVFPLLDVAEVIKPPHPRQYLDPRPARVARLFGDIDIRAQTGRAL